MLQGLMQDHPLLISTIMEYAAENHGDQEVVTCLPDGNIHRYTYTDAHARMKQLGSALLKLGIRSGDRVATLCWNDFRHFEAFHAVSNIGAVLHTVNPRLFKEQISYIINHAEDRILLTDPDFIPMLEALGDEISCLGKIVVMGDSSVNPDPARYLDYESLLKSGDVEFQWPEFDESSASSLCYTSGTTGNPKGVLYSHRSTVIHAMALIAANTMGITSMDVMMPFTPIFHANGWGIPYAVPMSGAKLVFLGKHTDPATFHKMVDEEKVTLSCAVPTVFTTLDEYLTRHGLTLDALKTVFCGGSAVPIAMRNAYMEKYQVHIMQLWGMTETSPLGTINIPTPKVFQQSAAKQQEISDKQGRIPYGVSMKVVTEDGTIAPRDGQTFGDIWVKGPWIASGYYRHDTDMQDSDGWFPTGDVGTIDDCGYMKITDRSKDVIKSGGEWISSVDLENAAIGHPKVSFAAVVGVYHPRWEERPILFVVPVEGENPTKEEILDFLSDKVAKWWLPEDVILLDDLPKTATGKISKLTLRQQYKDHLTN